MVALPARLLQDPAWIGPVVDTFFAVFLGFTLSMYLEHRRETRETIRRRAMYLAALEVELEHNLDVLGDIQALCEASGRDGTMYEVHHLRSFFYSVLLKHVRGLRTVVYDGIMTGGFLGELGSAVLTDALIRVYHAGTDLVLEAEASTHWLDRGLNEDEEHWSIRRRNIVAFIGRQAGDVRGLAERSIALVREERKKVDT
ncbi:MAG: hypothetical protein M0Z41_11940 [Peptococcaceae bacterium]|jgi:hypothetical protein|nr:hypothetical protein [Peptococcaceae bacterium]